MNILAPVNFSEASNNAALYAAQLAKELNSSLVLLHVISVPLTIPPVPLPGEMYDEMRADTMKRLKDLSENLTSATGVECTYIAEMGSLGFQLETAVKKYAPGMVVMGISKESATRVFFSSNVFETFNELSVPLIVVGEDVEYKKPSKIVMAYDFVSTKNIPAQSLLKYIANFNVDLEIVHVNTKDENISLEQIEDLKNFLQGKVCNVHLIDDDVVETGLHRFIILNKADQLILLPQNHGFFEFHTSETKRLLWKFEIPVVVMK